MPLCVYLLECVCVCVCVCMYVCVCVYVCVSKHLITLAIVTNYTCELLLNKLCCLFAYFILVHIASYTLASYKFN